MATAAVRLSQVVGALEYKGEAERLQETQRALKHSLEQLATAPLAQQEPALVGRIIQRSRGATKQRGRYAAARATATSGT